MQQAAASPPVWYSRALWVLGAICAVIWLAAIAVAIWARNEVAPAESIVALQSMMLAEHGTLYYSNREYPFTITAYMPLFYCLEALLYKLGIPIMIAGRLLSIGAAAGIVYCTWQIVRIYTRNNRQYAWLSALLCAYSTTIPIWGTVGRVDPLAMFFAFAAFYRFARFTEEDRPGDLWWSALFTVAAVMTKQTMVACPAAIFLLLLLRNRKAALQYGVAVAGSVAAVVGGLEYALRGQFLWNVVTANINPFGAGKLLQHGTFFATTVGALLFVAAAGVRRAIRASNYAPYLYLGCALAVLLGTAGKLGSDSNYHLESTVLLCICTGLALYHLDFLAKVFSGSKAWVTLLQAPLLIHMANNARISAPLIAERAAFEQRIAEQGRQLQPYLQNAPGPVLSMDFNVLLHTTQRLDVEPLIYNWLCRAGQIDPEPLRKEIAAGRIPVIVLHDDVNGRAPVDLEIPSLPASQLAEIRKRYKIVQRVEGPYFGGVFVYKPKTDDIARVERTEGSENVAR